MNCIPLFPKSPTLIPTPNTPTFPRLYIRLYNCFFIFLNWESRSPVGPLPSTADKVGILFLASFLGTVSIFTWSPFLCFLSLDVLVDGCPGGGGGAMIRGYLTSGIPQFMYTMGTGVGGTLNLTPTFGEYDSALVRCGVTERDQLSKVESKEAKPIPPCGGQ